MSDAEDDLIAHIDCMTFADLVDQLRDRGVEFNERDPHGDLRQDLLFDIASDEGCEAYMASLAA